MQKGLWNKHKSDLIIWNTSEFSNQFKYLISSLKFKNYLIVCKIFQVENASKFWVLSILNVDIVVIII